MNNEYELYHYGVKGMKWGVRRSLGVRARAAAVNKRYAAAANRRIKLMKTVSGKKGPNDRMNKRIERNEELIRSHTDLRNKLIKNLSPKDIKRGELAVNARWALGKTIKNIADGIDFDRGNSELRRNKQL